MGLSQGHTACRSMRRRRLLLVLDVGSSDTSKADHKASHTARQTRKHNRRRASGLHVAALVIDATAHTVLLARQHALEQKHTPLTRERRGTHRGVP